MDLSYSEGTAIMQNRIIARVSMAAVFILLSGAVFSYSDQTTTERILKENNRFIEFINVSITNFAENKKEEFLAAYDKHFNADVAYLQSDYRRAFKRIYASQGEMEKLYREMVKDHYLEDSKAILDRLAPRIIRSRSARARLYLTLGYRDRTVSWVHYTVGDASNPKLHSYKIYKFEDAIKMARRAKRYAFLALFESQTNEKKFKIYNQLCKNERAAGNLFFNRYADLNEEDYIKELGKSYMERQEENDAAKAGDAATKEAAREGRTFEKSVEKRVRFRNETKVARYLLNGEYEKAEDIMRQYIDDFNFKLINATFDMLTASEGELPQGDRVDFEAYKVHLVDNYARLSKDSMLDGLIEKVKVEDDVDKDADTEHPGVKTGGEKTE
ncbi:MAG: hypothetical protein JW838_09630 [Spirochaetes bacterium]|nr:hypothetical protein [Spirochaetota bacterium]